MKKRLMAGICTAALICSMGAAQAFATEDTAITTDQAVSADQTAPAGQKAAVQPQAGDNAPGWMRAGMTGAFKELTEEEKAQMQAEREAREAKQSTFIDSLTSEQKALYEAMMPEKPAEGDAAEGQPADKGMRVQLTEEEIAKLKENREAFVASLTDEQKTTFEELFMGHGHGFKELTEEEKAQMQAERQAREAEQSAFVDTLTSEQKALYEAMMPEKPADAAAQTGERPMHTKPTEAEMTAMKEKRDAFVASLTAEQKTTFEGLFMGRGHGKAPQEAAE